MHQPHDLPQNIFRAAQELQLNGGDKLALSPWDSQTFTTSLASGAHYSVTIATQPHTPTQSCTLINGNGVITNLDVVVTLSCTPLYDVWTWWGGPATASYGAQGVAMATNVPPPRQGAASWTDTTGNLWMFGGLCDNKGLCDNYMNDLWRYTPTTHLWTWMGGSNLGGIPGPAGVYGTQGVAVAGNIPGARAGAVSWTDPTGNFWLFGGTDAVSSATSVQLNDLWKYAPTTGLWTWVSGSSQPNASGVYGTQGVAASGNIPGARGNGVSWIDATGNLWLFGGLGSVSSTLPGVQFNDLWLYVPSTGLWTWVGGSNQPNASGTYGTRGTADTGNAPGARSGAVAWATPDGNFWLFGGTGYGDSGTTGFLNDFWKYNSASGLWVWLTGSDLAVREDTASTNSLPFGLTAANSWVDHSGNLWLFGGFAVINSDPLCLDILWEYSAATGQWVSIEEGYSVRGTQIGAPSLSILPSQRSAAASWTDASGNFWLFGGGNYEDVVPNDLWMYTPAP